MATRVALDHVIGVRIPVPQPSLFCLDVLHECPCGAITVFIFKEGRID